MKRRQFITNLSLLALIPTGLSLTAKSKLLQDQQYKVRLTLLVDSANITQQNKDSMVEIVEGSRRSGKGKTKEFESKVKKNDKILWSGAPMDTGTGHRIVIDSVDPKPNSSFDILEGKTRVTDSFGAKVKSNAKKDSVMPYNIIFSIYEGNTRIGQFTVDPKLKVVKT